MPTKTHLFVLTNSSGCWTTVLTLQIVERSRSTNSFTVSQLRTTVRDSWDRLTTIMLWQHQRLYMKEKIRKTDLNTMEIIMLPLFQIWIQVSVILKASNNYRIDFQKSNKQHKIQISKSHRCQTLSAEKSRTCSQNILITILSETIVWKESSKWPTQP